MHLQGGQSLDEGVGQFGGKLLFLAEDDVHALEQCFPVFIF